MVIQLTTRVWKLISVRLLCGAPEVAEGLLRIEQFQPFVRVAAHWLQGQAEGSQRLVAVTSRDSAGAPAGIEVHVLNDKVAYAQPDEATQLAHFLRRL